MELVLPNNYVVIDEEEMMYLDGGTYLSKRACQGICVALAMSRSFNQKTNKLY